MPHEMLMTRFQHEACTTTPARVKDCNTVGGRSIVDMRTQMSNYGAVLTLFAPGKDVLAASNKTTDTFVYWTGTSVASAHVRLSCSCVFFFLPSAARL